MPLVPTVVVDLQGAKRADFSPLVGTARGGAAGAFFPGVGVSGRLTARPRRRKRPSSKWTYNEWVYATVEELWQRLTDEKREAWRFAWKAHCLSGRDMFGKWNHVLVGRYGRWLEVPPERHLKGKLRFLADGTVPLPFELRRALGGDFAPVAGLVSCEQWIRSGYASSPGRWASWNDAWSVVLAKPFVRSTFAASIQNRGYQSSYGGNWNSTFYQAYCRLTVLPGVIRAWVPWILTIGGGWPGSGPKGYTFRVQGYLYTTKGGTYEDWLIGWVTPGKGLIVNGDLPGGWIQPGLPPAAGQWVGTDSMLIVPAILAR